MKNIKRYAASAILAGAIAAPALASTASAGPIGQDGLVNVVLSDVTVQVPVALAANICDVSVNAIATQFDGGMTDCDALAQSEATNEENNAGGRDRRVRQSGLVNLFVDDLTIQVPIGIALNLCDIDVNVLALQVDALGQTTCDAVAGASAQN